MEKGDIAINLFKARFFRISCVTLFFIQFSLYNITRAFRGRQNDDENDNDEKTRAARQMRRVFLREEEDERRREDDY
jgi:hypothetical protein